MNHEQQSAPDSQSEKLRGPKSDRTERSTSVRRVYDEKFSLIVEGVLLGLNASGDHRANNASIGRALSVDESRVRQIRANGGWSMGDVLAMAAHAETREAARKVIGSLEAVAVESTAMRRVAINDAPATIGASFGRFCTEVIAALADGVVDGAEPEMLRNGLLNIIRECSAAIQALDARSSAPLAKASPRASRCSRVAAGGAR